MILRTVSERSVLDNLDKIFATYVALRSRFDVGVLIECLTCILDFCFEPYS